MVARQTRNANNDPDDDDDGPVTPDPTDTDSRVKKLIKDALKEYADENKPAPRRTQPPGGIDVISQLFGR